MKEYNVTLYEMKVFRTFRVRANSQKEAIEKVESLGFNCGIELSSDNYGKFKVKSINEVSKDYYLNENPENLGKGRYDNSGLKLIKKHLKNKKK